MTTPLEPHANQVELRALAFTIELWTHDASGVEQTLARALSAPVARAIFAAAKEEHPGRHIVLRQGERIVDKS